MFTNSPELFTNRDNGMSMVCTALACWARSDATSAIDWLRGNPQPFSEFATAGIVSAVAEQDPQLAFQLLSAPVFEQPIHKVWKIFDSTKTLEAKSAALAGMREYLTTIRDETARERVVETSLRGIAGSTNRESFEPVTRWIAGESFTPSELTQLARELDIYSRTDESGRWIEWLRQSLPTQAADQQVAQVIDQSGLSDYQAAARWAITQPPGKDRDQIFKTNHGNWPKEEPAGKETFAKEHGINK